MGFPSYSCAVAFWRKRHPIQVVAVTGSNGKTTTKELISSILARNYRVLKTPGNFNNLVGLPLTLLQLNQSHEVGVLEMGMNRFGEIRRLTEIARPDIGVITNIQMAHAANLGDIEGIMAAKGELFEGMDDRGIAIVNSDDQRVYNLGTMFKGKRITFGLGVPCDVWASKIENLGVGGIAFTLHIMREDIRIHLKSLGIYNLYNALAAAAVAVALNMEMETIKGGIEDFKPLSKRMEILEMPDGIKVINDSYNANPGSMVAALKTLTDLKNDGRGIVVLGDMLELGDASKSAHYHIGKSIAQSKIDHLMVIGDYAESVLKGAMDAGMSTHKLFRGRTHKDLSLKLKETMKAGDWVLVKGSRNMHMEILIDELTKNLQT
ncbi:MAG TPA: UDP-N-acetylmuramoyl-tripeptide--D-alanyl-D-alanine ligase [Syntrophaceae bacterium]|nr:UDP-N-acetylmuramoyl-tripeptide--D-alanyl-D-alanine ligase [Syntrophaceae bacterium]